MAPTGSVAARRGHGVPQMWSSVSDDLLIPEAALPTQFYDIWHHTRAVSPDRALVLAMLWQAVIDLQKYRFAARRRQQRLYMEAYQWVASEDRRWAYSFVNLCDALNLSAESLRAKLLSDAPPAGVAAAAVVSGDVEQAA